MCLDYQKLKTYKDNNKIRVGFKVFCKTPTGYENRFFNKGRIKYQIGERVDNNNIHEKQIKCESYAYYRREFKPKYYKAGFHFYTKPPHWATIGHTFYDLRIVECICENITATGQQNYKDAFVAQSYRLMREV